MPRKATNSKMDTVLTTEITETNYVDAITAPKKAATKKAAPKAEPEKELDWRAVGLLREHQSARVRAIRKIDRIKLTWLYYVASAFMAGLALGVMLTAWLR